ncbi:glutamate--tRNA ligase [bacterium]|nr:glutamate--tRNA ligase [bacterium]
MTSVITRFPPSPTGALHVGSARTALFSYLFARSKGGKFLLRIEDTDRERSRQEYTDQILEAMRWLGLEWDGDVVYQSKNEAAHRAASERLLKQGSAYRCFCTEEMLEAKRVAMRTQGRPYRYDGTCRNVDPAESERRAAAGEKFVVRVRKPEGGMTYRDLLHGEIKLRGEDLDDIILMKSDGRPLYHLAVVCDDIAAGVTHVIRGDDHLDNTPKQMVVYQALGAPLPEYIHIPLILGSDKKRLSKREGAENVLDYRAAGFQPDAVLNFLALLGWSHPESREILTKAELIGAFSVDRVGTAAAVFDQTKLRFLNGKHIHDRPPADRARMLADFLKTRGETPPDLKDLAAMIEVNGQRGDTLAEIADYIRFLWERPKAYDEAAVAKFLAGKAELIEKIRCEFEALADFEGESIEIFFRDFAERQGVKFKDVGQAIRVMLTGKSVSPPIFQSAAVLGRVETLLRIDAAQSLMKR